MNQTSRLQALLDAAVDSRRLQDRLAHLGRLATIGEMASGIAHELNQPLAAIATYAHACDRLLSRPEPDVAEIQGALREIAGQAVRAGEIIRRLRSLARAEEIRRVPVDLNAVILELTDLMQGDAQAHGAQLHLDLSPQLPQVNVDPRQIQQVVLNLVRNALEALVLAPPPAPEVLIRTCAAAQAALIHPSPAPAQERTRPGPATAPELVHSDPHTAQERTRPGPALLQELEIHICDNGPGISGQVAERMFDPFYSTRAAGTGLGLAIARTIVRAHEGTLSYRPNAPAGAHFIVRLAPAAAIPA